MTLRILPGLVLAALLQLLPVMAASAYEVTAPGRVVAFGDVHGAYEDWVTLLQEVGVINADLDWSGGNTYLVSLGDLIDRGPGSRSVVALMMKLDAQAEAAGKDRGVVVLPGRFPCTNHRQRPPRRRTLYTEQWC